MMIQLRKISVDARQILRPADYQPRGLHLRQAHNLGKPVAMPTPADPPAACASRRSQDCFLQI